VPLHYVSFHDQGNDSAIGSMQIIGVLYVDSRTSGLALSTTQLQALETLASEAAVAINSARLYREAQEKRRLDEDLALAREIQQALLPTLKKELSFVTAYGNSAPCREIGGDYFDYFEIAEDKFGFAIGDVAGKGISAALLASMLQGIITGQGLLDLPIPVMIENVNRSLVRRGTGNRFVTFFFGILAPGGACTYTNAGHNPPFLLHRDGTLALLEEGGMVLGLFAGAQYSSATVQLAPGDHLVLFTDGVLEARNASGEEFGEDRLRALLIENARCPASRILSRILEAVAVFSENARQHDDITAMVLGYRGNEQVHSIPAGKP
jgi:sigma-B regulation protein RsbU (phosphoserine phosphatase)